MPYLVCLIILGISVRMVPAVDNGSSGYRNDGTGVSRSALLPMPQAQKLWESEARIPIPWVTGIGCMGGYGSVAFADGRAFLSTYEPSGDFVQEVKLKMIRRKRGPEAYALTDADDVLWCMDLATGKTLWKSVQVGKGYNPCALGGELYVTPCIIGERVYNYGNLGVITCHDVRTGDVLWETALPEGKKARQVLEAWKADDHRYEKKWPKGKIRVMAMKYHHNAARTRSPIAVGGVLVVHDFNSGAVGLDAGNGTILWEQPGVLAGRGSTPVSLGDDRVLLGNRGALACVQAINGKQLWRVKSVEAGFGFGFVTDGSHVVAGGGHKTGAITCLKIADDKASVVWHGPASMPASSGVVIVNGHVWAVVRQAGTAKQQNRTQLLAFELATGQQVGSVDLGNFNTNYTHLAYSDGLVGMSSYGAKASRLFVADPANPRAHGQVLPGTTYCITPAMADGLFITRTNNRVVCWRIGQ